MTQSNREDLYLFDPDRHRAMIDLEFLKSAPSGRIISIGAAVWTMRDGVGVRDEWLVNWQDGQVYSEVDAGAAMFWLKRAEDPSARRELFSGPRCHVEVAILELRDWLDKHQVTEVWCRGSLDEQVLNYHCKRLVLPRLWEFWRFRDMRTIFHALPEAERDRPVASMDLATMIAVDRPHTALGDAVWQAEVTARALRRLAPISSKPPKSIAGRPVHDAGWFSVAPTSPGPRYAMLPYLSRRSLPARLCGIASSSGISWRDMDTGAAVSSDNIDGALWHRWQDDPPVAPESVEGVEP